LDINSSILQSIRVAVGLNATTVDYDIDLLIHINGAIGKLNHNGVGNFLVVDGETQKWIDLQNPLQTEGNKFFQMIPQFIMLSVKLIFDPPPPSSVQYHVSSVEQMLWRLKIAYEEPYVAPTITGGDSQWN
jgi:hypothetical protein